MRVLSKTNAGLGCRVQGLGFRVQGSEFRVWGLGFRVEGVVQDSRGCCEGTDEGLGFRV
jgi:hypothetical protein